MQRRREPLLGTTVEAFAEVCKRKQMPAALGLESAPRIVELLDNMRLGINQKRRGDTGDLFIYTCEYMYTTFLNEQYSSVHT